jgi:MinD-like ATPase involved in chromosome partitioning or flagellar assembly
MASILSFYSYKGGVGRTMAVANIAVLLARKGLRVLVVDWDLEAPGLHRYFADLKVTGSNSGLLDFFLAAASKPERIPEWRSFARTINIDDSTRLTMLTAGNFDDAYQRHVLEFDWNDFFLNRRGGAVLESLRRQWIDSFDVTLIDSRTGITDSGGICTVLMPDILVPVLAANRQSLYGTKQVIQRAQQARQELAYDRTRLLVFPLISRFDSRTEHRESQAWLKLFAEELKDFFSDWLPKTASVLQVLERTKIPYVAFFSFGEKLPVITEGTTDPESLGFAYLNAAMLIENDFKDVESLLLPAIAKLSRQAISAKFMARCKSHQNLTSPKLEDITTYGFVGVYCYPEEVISISAPELEQFVNQNRFALAEEIRHSQGVDVFQNSVAVAHHRRAIRQDIKSSHRITLYTDGFVALDAQADVMMRNEQQMHLGWFTYEVQRHLQLTKALLENREISAIQVMIDFKNIEQFTLLFAGWTGLVHTAPYSGHHESLHRLVRLSDIYDHSGVQRNVVMPVVKDIVSEVCRIFGLSQVPPGIWNDSDELIYVKGLESSR